MNIWRKLTRALGLFRRTPRRRKARVLFVGLNNAGKSTLLNRLKSDREQISRKMIAPTVGFTADMFVCEYITRVPTTRAAVYRLRRAFRSYARQGVLRRYTNFQYIQYLLKRISRVAVLKIIMFYFLCNILSVLAQHLKNNFYCSTSDFYRLNDFLNEKI